MKVPDSISKFLNEPYSLKPEHLSFYDKNRFIKLKQVLNDETLEFFNKEISRVVDSINTNNVPLEKRDTYGKAFLQLFNLWTKDEIVKTLVLSPRLGGIASGLMQTKGARIYHDQALFKEGGGGITPWHADQYYWPLETDKSITAWIPLQETKLEMGPLEFSAGSHKLVEGRDLQISDESEAVLGKKLRVTDFQHVIEPFDAGEISFHSGWTFHRAGANTTNKMRKVMTIIYMDSDMKLKKPDNENQINDWNTWCPGAEIGKVINTKLNPVVN